MLNCFAVRSAPPLGENVDLVMAVRAGKVAHILDDAEHFDVDLREHLHSLARVLQADIAGRGDDHRAGQRNGLDQRDHHVAGARRQIDDEVVEFAPIHLLQKLADDLVKHGAAHDQRLVAGRNVADRDGLDSVGQVGLDAVACADLGLLGRAHHERHVGAVDVGVDEAHALAELAERDGQVDGDSGFADAALAGTDSDDFGDARQGDRRRHGR